MLIRLDSWADPQGMGCEVRVTNLYSLREKKYFADLLLTFSGWLMNSLIGESFDNLAWLGRLCLGWSWTGQCNSKDLSQSRHNEHALNANPDLDFDAMTFRKIEDRAEDDAYVMRGNTWERTYTNQHVCKSAWAFTQGNTFQCAGREHTLFCKSAYTLYAKERQNLETSRFLVPTGPYLKLKVLYTWISNRSRSFFIFDRLDNLAFRRSRLSFTIFFLCKDLLSLLSLVESIGGRESKIFLDRRLAYASYSCFKSIETRRHMLALASAGVSF